MFCRKCRRDAAKPCARSTGGPSPTIYIPDARLIPTACVRACVRSDQVVNAFVPPRPASRSLFHLCHDFFVSISQRRQFNRRAFVESCSNDNRMPPGRVPLLMAKEWRDTRAINADTASECLAAAGRGDDMHSFLCSYTDRQNKSCPIGWVPSLLARPKTPQTHDARCSLAVIIQAQKQR